MKAMIVDMCILSHKTVFFDVRTCRRRRGGQTEGFARKVSKGSMASGILRKNAAASVPQNPMCTSESNGVKIDFPMQQP